AADRAVDEQHVAIRIVAADLALALAQETVVTHPVGEVMRQPGAALGAIIVGPGCADLEREGLVPMHALGAIGHVETVLDAEAGMFGNHLIGELVRADVKAAPALRVANEAGNRHWA